MRMGYSRVTVEEVAFSFLWTPPFFTHLVGTRVGRKFALHHDESGMRPDREFPTA